MNHVTNQEFLNKLHKVHGYKIKPLQPYKKARIKILCKCNQCGNLWKTTPNKLLCGRGCPKCDYKQESRKQTISNTTFQKQFHKKYGYKIVPLERYKGCSTKIYFKCSTCGLIWKARPDYMLHKSDGCPKCERHRRSIQERMSKNEFKKKLYNVHGFSITLIGKYKNAHTKTKFKCKHCGHIWKQTPNDVLGGTGCPKCGLRRRSREERMSNKEFLKQLRKIHGDTIIPLEPYKNSSTKILCLCRKCKFKWRAISSRLLQGSGCPRCGKRIQQHEECTSNALFIRKLHKKCGNKIMPLQKYKRENIAILVQCNICGLKWHATPQQLLNGMKCPKCHPHWKIQKEARAKRAAEERWPNTEFLHKLNKIHHGTIIALQKYINSYTKILCKCAKCGRVWKVQPQVLLRGNGCPNCHSKNRSHGEICILHWLNQYCSKKFMYGYIIPSNHLHFDFWIPSIKLAIEFDGIQHFKYSPFFCSHNPEQFKKAVQRDYKKNEYCLQNHITLIRIQNFKLDGNYNKLYPIINHILSRVFSAYRHHRLHTHIYRFNVNNHGRLIRNRKQSA